MANTIVTKLLQSYMARLRKARSSPPQVAAKYGWLQQELRVRCSTLRIIDAYMNSLTEQEDFEMALDSVLTMASFLFVPTQCWSEKETETNYQIFEAKEGEVADFMRSLENLQPDYKNNEKPQMVYDLKQLCYGIVRTYIAWREANVSIANDFERGICGVKNLEVLA